MEKKMLPVGEENFQDLIKGGFYYVDKTGLIKDLLTNFSKVTLFTRPRRFGKSLNISMLQSFFEIDADPSLFNGTVISKEKKLCEKHMGKYPVISISLKSMDGENYSEAYSMYDSIINQEALRHIYLMDSPQISSYEKDQLESLLKGGCSIDKLRNSLWLLSSLLYQHFGQKAIILIDEYDVPLAKAYERGYYEQMVNLIRGLFEKTLKTNGNMHFAVLTGCMRIAKESIFTGLNNLKIQSITSKLYDEYFGFTEDEVKSMLAYYELEECYQDIKTWYDGYLFGDEYVYCPWDVINYLFDRRGDCSLKPTNYWANSSGNDIIRKLLKKATPTVKREVEKLMAGESLTKKIYSELTYAEIDKSIDHIWSVMYTTGYLTGEATEQSSNHSILKLRIPNEEVLNIYEEHVVTWFDEQAKTDVNRYTEFIEAFINSDVPKINEMFNGYLRETIRIRDTFVRNETKENFYHGFLLGILKFSNEWATESNTESGEGFSDIQLRFVDKPIGAVIELKYGKSENLDDGCAEALRQIEEKHYTDALKNDGCKHIYKYGIACYKKQCKVVMEEEIVD